MAERVRKAIGAYMQAKYDADKDLVKRTAFKWTILRPGGLSNEPGTGKASIGRTHITKTISVSQKLSLHAKIFFLIKCQQRDDVAYTLALLLDRPYAAGLAIDIVGGEEKIEDALDAFIKKGETDFLG